MTASTMVGTGRKFMQFGIFIFLEAQEINQRDNGKVGRKCDGGCIFFENLFRFTRKFLPLLSL